MSIIAEILADEQTAVQEQAAAEEKQRQAEDRRQAEAREAYCAMVYRIVDGQGVGKQDVLATLKAADKTAEQLDADVETVQHLKTAIEDFHNPQKFDKRVETTRQQFNRRKAETKADFERLQAELDKLKADCSNELDQLETSAQEARDARQAVDIAYAHQVKEHGEMIGCDPELSETIRRAKISAQPDDPTVAPKPNLPDWERQRIEMDIAKWETTLATLRASRGSQGQHHPNEGIVAERLEKYRCQLGPWIQYDRSIATFDQRKLAEVERLERAQQWLTELEAFTPNWRALTFH